MKQKISNHVKNNWQEYASVILMLFIITVAMIYKFNLFNFDITYPIAYSGGDDLSMLVDVLRTGLDYDNGQAGCTKWNTDV